MGETASYTPICDHSRSSPTPERLQKHEEQRGRCRIPIWNEGKNLGQRDTRVRSNNGQDDGSQRDSKNRESCTADSIGPYGGGLLLLYRDTCADILSSVNRPAGSVSQDTNTYCMKRRKEEGEDSWFKSHVQSRAASARSNLEDEQVSEHRHRQMTPSESNDLVTYTYPPQGGRSLPHRNTFMCEHLDERSRQRAIVFESRPNAW
ncbi:hypothetical protein FNAPI_5390 [Fusarium napiforme]|uniref:Uncharacterized protein n=1 Tax=Fusarium napiforme TaxID=42672 RepID=A0A8H5N8M6_9HYPO|nr:hypothetical protein FNAPI_5390 [Fusarium napiforme]